MNYSSPAGIPSFTADLRGPYGKGVRVPSPRAWYAGAWVPRSGSGKPFGRSIAAGPYAKAGAYAKYGMPVAPTPFSHASDAPALRARRYATPDFTPYSKPGWRAE